MLPESIIGSIRSALSLRSFRSTSHTEDNREYLHHRDVVEDGFIKLSEPQGSVENHIMSLEMDERNLSREEVPESYIMVQMMRSSHHYSLRSKNRGGATLLHIQKGSITLSFEDDGVKKDHRDCGVLFSGMKFGRRHFTCRKLNKF